MGRARGTKRTRGSWPPELLDLQRRGGMAPDWHETWHQSSQGLRDVVPSVPSASLQMEDTEIIEFIDNHRSLSAITDWPQEIEVGATLVNPLQNAREYRGVIRINHYAQDGIVFEGVTEYGRSGRVGSHSKVVYKGRDLRAAAEAVNTMIDKKLGGDYETPPGEAARVDSDLARSRAQDFCREAGEG